jgi:hypothetical protein
LVIAAGSTRGRVFKQFGLFINSPQQDQTARLRQSRFNFYHAFSLFPFTSSRKKAGTLSTHTCPVRFDFYTI